jgi:hypothetical protein
MERTLMVTQRSSLVPGHITVESKRSGFVARALIAAGFAVASLSPLSAAHASGHSKQQAGISAPDKKAEAKAAREKKKAERAAAKAEKKSKKDHGDGDKVAKVDNKRSNDDDMSAGDDPLEGL